MRKSYYWKLKQRELTFGSRTLIMGVLNVTPDSFSDGGKFSDPDHAYAHALALEEQGADIIDIGAESTRPDAKPIPAEEELRRLVPVLKRLREKLTIPISIDTYKSEVAERALELGAEIINDPTGLTYDPDLSNVVTKYDAGLIINHMRGRPETWAKLPPLPDVMLSITKDLDASINRARRNGVDRGRMMIDPGIGFGKRKEQNIEILARLKEMEALDLPILVGASRKSFLAQTTEADTRLATAAAVTAAILNGAHMVRVHDVAEMRIVAALTDEIVKALRVPADVEEKPRTRVAAKQRPDTESELPRSKPLIVPMLKRVKPVEEEPVEEELLAEPPEDSSESSPEPLPFEKPAAAEERKPIRKFAADSERKPFRKSAGDAERKPYRRPDGDGERRPYTPRTGSAGEGRPPYRSAAGGDDRRPPFRKAAAGSDERRPPYRSSDSSSDERRPPFRKSTGDGERRPYTPRTGGSSEGRPPFRPREGAGDDRRPPFRKSSPGGDDRRPPFRPREGGDDRRPPFRKSAGDGERRPYTPRTASSGEGRPPFRKSAGDGERRPYTPRTGSSSEGRPPFRKPAGSDDRRPYTPREGGSASGRPPFRSGAKPPFKKRTGPPGRGGKPGGRPPRS
jgi:dihydropteroate synthase